MPSLYGVLEKRKWANHHLVLIEKLIADFFGSDPYPVITDPHPEEGVYHCRLVYPKKLPVRDLALMIGDCVHNMRSALDYVAWEVAGADIADMETMFPIYDTAAGFAKNAPRRIKRLPLNAQTLIEQLQPYDTRYGGNRLMLSAINKIDSADKHKLLTIATAIAEQVTCRHGFPGSTKPGKHRTRLGIFPGAGLVHNAIIATFYVVPPIPKMEVDFKFTPQVEFTEIHGIQVEHAFVVQNLKNMLTSLDVVIKKFRDNKFFP